jgi:triosephosphate isomerase
VVICRYMKKQKRRKIVIGNWKMNPQDSDSARKIFKEIKKKAALFPQVEVVIAAPYVFIPLLSKSLGKVLLGAQDVSNETSGSYTGEVAAAMLASLGVSFAIIGHSERRARGETNALIADKVARAHEARITAVLCVGEETRDANGDYLEFLKNQLRESLSKVAKKNLGKLVIAYEPVWAIGKSYGDAMKGPDVLQVVIFIKKTLADLYGKEESAKVLIIYGGSVAPVNAEDILVEGGVDGFLPGRQSLEANGFGEIVSIVAKS